jgi:UDP-N-acetyl-D-mannosaminuronic acid dehydrogenase
VGGHCIAVDPWFIAAEAPDCTPLIQTARRVNDGKSRWVIEQVQARASALEDQLGRPARIGCLGLAFKPDVDDLRESPALHITTELLVAGLEVLACEPNLHDHPTIKLHSLEQVLADADLLVFLVAHTPFRSLDLTGRTVFDLCGVTEQDGSL